MALRDRDGWFCTAMRDCIELGDVAAISAFFFPDIIRIMEEGRRTPARRILCAPGFKERENPCAEKPAFVTHPYALVLLLHTKLFFTLNFSNHIDTSYAELPKVLVLLG
jgi:hypothetical protein